MSEVLDFRRAESVPWLTPVREDMLRLIRTGRLPHALLILAKDGLGTEALADWIAAAALCESRGKEASAPTDGAPYGVPYGVPCGECPSCRLLLAGNHPDLYRVEREEDAQQLKVEQVRELIESISLTSYRGGFKVGMLIGADKLNAAGANAFLKTLEEPPANTLLMLLATPNHRLPATIASRCRRVTLSLPDEALSIEWLHGQGIGAAEAAARLRLSQGAPIGALQVEAAAAQSLDQEMAQALGHLEAARSDVSLVAERWLKSDLGLRLAWLENWITERVRTLSQPAPANLKTVDAVVLPASLLKAKIRRLFELLDDTRELKRLTGTSVNLQLALESMLIRHFVQDR